MRSSILKRFAIIALVALALASVSSLILSYAYGSHEAFEAGADSSEAAAEIVCHYFETKGLQTMPTPGSKEYDDLHELMQWTCNLYRFEYMALLSANEQRTVRTYYIVVSSDEQNTHMLEKTFTYGMTDDRAFSENELSAFRGDGLRDAPEQGGGGFKRTYAWHYPMYLKGLGDYCVIDAEVNVSALALSTNDNALSFAVPMIVILVLVIAMELYLLNSNVVNPLRVVSSRMRTFIGDRARHDEPLQLGRNDEIGEIADSFNKMTVDIERYVDRIEDMAEERAASATELQVARRIQLGLVPETCEKSGPGFEAFALFRAAREVGGDFYDLFIREDGRVCVVMADVSGKGVSAALFMAMVRTLIHEKLVRGMSPSKALNETNDAILQNNPEGMFVTVFAGVYNPASRELLYANAGHTRPYIVGRGYLTPDPGIALGIFEEAGIVDEMANLMPGEGVLLYTDGATEAVSAEKTFYGEERLAQAVCKEEGAQATVLGLTASIDTFVAGNEQFDDLTLLSLFARSEDVWHWKLSPQLSSFATLREGMLELCGNTPPVRRALLAIDEAFSNVVNYSGASEVGVWANREKDQLSISLVDDGVAFNPLEYHADERDFEDFENGGMGISLIKQAVTKLSYERVGKRNVLNMTFDLSEG